MGHALTQIPQAMHLLAGFPSFKTMTFMGQTSTHLPQETQSFLLIMYTPVLGFWVMAPCSHAFSHLPHWIQVMGFAPEPLATIWMQE